MRKDAGFTMIELFIVMAIMAIMATFAIPNFMVWRANYELRGATQVTYSHFQRARLLAVKENSFCTITFNQSVGGQQYDYVVYVDSDRDLVFDEGDDDEGEEVIAKMIWKDHYSEVSLDTSQGGGDGLSFEVLNDDGLPSVAFRPTGMISNNIGGSIHFKNKNNKTECVTLNSVGGVRIGCPG